MAIKRCEFAHVPVCSPEPRAIPVNARELLTRTEGDGPGFPRRFFQTTPDTEWHELRTPPVAPAAEHWLRGHGERAGDRRRACGRRAENFSKTRSDKHKPFILKKQTRKVRGQFKSLKVLLRDGSAETPPTLVPGSDGIAGLYQGKRLLNINTVFNNSKFAVYIKT